MDNKLVDDIFASVKKYLDARLAKITGEKGADGLNGKDGTVGEKGADGLNGKDGTVGEDGRDGRDGTIGKDATEVTPLFFLAADRRYPMGTWSMYRGGMVRALRDTDPIGDAGELEKTGWSVVWNGIDEIAIEQGEDPREIGLAVKTTDGKVALKTIRIPMVLDKGVYRATTVYEKGDSVTWDGSTWIALVDHPEDKPGVTMGQWRMSTRKGTNGKDGVPGDRGEQGLPGKNGRDYN